MKLFLRPRLIKDEFNKINQALTAYVVQLGLTETQTDINEQKLIQANLADMELIFRFIQDKKSEIQTGIRKKAEREVEESKEQGDPQDQEKIEEDLCKRLDAIIQGLEKVCQYTSSECQKKFSILFNADYVIGGRFTGIDISALQLARHTLLRLWGDESMLKGFEQCMSLLRKSNELLEGASIVFNMAHAQNVTAVGVSVALIKELETLDSQLAQLEKIGIPQGETPQTPSDFYSSAASSSSSSFMATYPTGLTVSQSHPEKDQKGTLDSSLTQLPGKTIEEPSSRREAHQIEDSKGSQELKSESNCVKQKILAIENGIKVHIGAVIRDVKVLGRKRGLLEDGKDTSLARTLQGLAISLNASQAKDCNVIGLLQQINFILSTPEGENQKRDAIKLLGSIRIQVRIDPAEATPLPHSKNASFSVLYPKHLIG